MTEISVTVIMFIVCKYMIVSDLPFDVMFSRSGSESGSNSGSSRSRSRSRSRSHSSSSSSQSGSSSCSSGTSSQGTDKSCSPHRYCCTFCSVWLILQWLLVFCCLLLMFALQDGITMQNIFIYIFLGFMLILTYRLISAFVNTW